MKMSMMIPVAGLSMLAGGVMGMALSPKKKTKMQKTVSKAAKVAAQERGAVPSPALYTYDRLRM